MIALFWLFLAVSVSPFKSKNRLAAENAALRHRLIVLQRRVRGRAACPRTIYYMAKIEAIAYPVSGS